MSFILKTRSMKKEAKMLDILSSFGITCNNVSVFEGASVDTYSLSLKMGCRSSRVSRVLVDIGMLLGSHTVPIGSPNTKSGVYEISVQNKQLESKCIGSLISSIDSANEMLCPVLIGTGIDGTPMVVDLNRFPNLLIGGIPGAGKSMLLHSIIISCIRNGSEVYLCDPKMVEFSSYKNNIVKDIGYNINDFYNTINNLSQIMNSRYKTFSRLSARNISHYNDLNKERNFMLRKSKMDPIVFVIDEWADIYFEDKNIESRLCSLAQKGRAAGISIVLATQRPSAKVVSGLIKASFPGRISMRTSSAIDSRVIIEQSGAEKIMDPGTGLLKDPYSFSPVLFRTPFVDINIIDKVMEMS